MCGYIGKSISDDHISDDQDGKMARYFRLKNEKDMFLY